MTSKTEQYAKSILAAKNAFHKMCPNGTWRHHKGGIYAVVGYSIDRATKNVVVHHRRVAGENFDPVAEAYIVFSTIADEFCDEKRWTPVKPVHTTDYVDMTNGQY